MASLVTAELGTKENPHPYKYGQKDRIKGHCYLNKKGEILRCEGKNRLKNVDYYKKNRDRINANRRKWHEKNRDKINANHRKWSQENRDKINAKQMIYREKNRDKINTNRKKRRLDNIEKERKRERKYQKENKKKIKEYKKEYYQKNKVYLDKINSQYYQKNKEQIKEYSRQRYQENKEQIKEYASNYYQENKEQIKEYASNYQKEHRNEINLRLAERYRTDPLFRLICNTRSRMLDALKRQGASKNQRTMEYINCSVAYLYNHLESQFEPWMTWDNCGVYNPNGPRTWQIDHRKPCKCFDLLNDEEQKYMCFHWTNLQPLCSKDNIVDKNDKFDPETFRYKWIDRETGWVGIPSYLMNKK